MESLSLKQLIKFILEDKDAHFISNWVITDHILSLIIGRLEGIEKEIYATTINPNPMFQDGSQEQFWMKRCYKLQEALQAMIEEVKK